MIELTRSVGRRKVNISLMQGIEIEADTEAGSGAIVKTTITPNGYSVDESPAQICAMIAKATGRQT